MSFSSLDWAYALLCSFTQCFSFSLITVGIPVLPQYFRDAHIYEAHVERVNVTVGDR